MFTAEPPFTAYAQPVAAIAYWPVFITFHFALTTCLATYEGAGRVININFSCGDFRRSFYAVYSPFFDLGAFLPDITA